MKEGRSVAFYTIGISIIFVGFAMMVPLIFEIMDYHESHAFLYAITITLICGTISVLLSKIEDKRLRSVFRKQIRVREVFFITSASWVFMIIFSAIPLYFSHLNLSFISSIFEVTSGYTTTGATVIIGLDQVPKSILLWRSLTNWIGGVGIIAIAIIILPSLKLSGMQLFKSESSDNSDKVFPKLAHLSLYIIGTYVTISVIFVILLTMTKMDLFDAVNHVMSAIATAGLSTHDASVGYFNDVTIEILLSVLMVIGSLPFTLYIRIAKGYKKKNFSILKDDQVRWFLMILLVFILSLSVYLTIYSKYNFWESLRISSFNLISIISSTGFSSIGYDNISGGLGFVFVIFFIATFVGGCTGSTSGGIKIFRIVIIFRLIGTQIRQALCPHGIFLVKYNGNPIEIKTLSSILTFVILYIITFFASALLVSLSGLDFTSSLSSAIACLSNAGPGLGPILGPSGTYAGVNDFGKFVLSVTMLLGRLEIFTLLVVLLPSFWKK